jgi:hypothetical protein
MKKLLFSALMFAVCLTATAQKYNGVVRGNLKDSAGKQGLHDATVSVLAAKDSSLISFTISSNSGYFEIKNVPSGDYVALISYQGFITLRKRFAITDKSPVADLGSVFMVENFKSMDEVIVRDEVPIKVKGDTIVYNANSFKVLNPNGTAEDLLKKLPGVQVERDGTVKAQGETVPKIYVDGKEFFGNDPKMATKNLTADMIDEVEVYDDMSDQAKFNGVDDGSRTRVMNLKLKKDKKQGMFGRASGGYGTDDRYNGNLSANYFKGATKLSVVARANNTNNIGFTNNDNLGIFSAGSAGGNRGGNSSGITKNWNVGTNYSDLWGKNLELTGSYFFNHLNNSNNSRSSSIYTFPKDSVVNKMQTGISRNYNDNHRANLRFTYTIDSMNSLIYTPNLNLQSSKSNRIDSSENFNTGKPDLSKVNDSRSVQENKGDGINWSNNITLRHKTSKKGRTISLNLTNSLNNNDRDGSTVSRIGSFRNGVKTRETIINQISHQKTESKNYSAGISYTEPLGRDKVLEFNYRYNKNENSSNRRVFDFDTVSGKYSRENVAQTNVFQNSNESNRLGTNFRVVKKKYNYQLGIAAQKITLISDNISKKQFIEQTYTNLFPTASFNYNFARSKALRFQYRGSTNQPSTSQLQETTDKNNALYWTRGNTALRQEYNNNFSLTYNYFNMTSFKNYFFRLGFSNTNNQIVNNIISGPRIYKEDTIDRGVQLTIPVNANGAYNFNGNANIGFPIKRMKGGNFNTTTSVRIGRDISFVDSVKNISKNITLGESVHISYTYKEKLDISVGAGIDYNAARYSLYDQNNNSYYNYTASGDISYILPKDFIISTDGDFIATSGLASGYNQNYFLWNASFSKQMLKNKRGELKFSVYDILKQNRSISRNFGSNYIQDVQNSAVQRFFMLSFTYNLNRMGNRNTRVNGTGGARERTGEGRTGGGTREFRGRP